MNAKPKFEVRADVSPTLEDAQKFVGGYIEIVPLTVNGRKAQLLCDEEGLLKGLTKNQPATLMADRLIVGNALLLTGRALWK